MCETGAQRAPRLSAFRSPRRFPLRRRGSGCGAFRKRFGPGVDRKIWEMAALILEEAILFGRNDGIDDPVAAAGRRVIGGRCSNRPALEFGFDQRFERVRYRGCITARYEGLTLRENPGLGCRSRASGSSPRGNFAVSLPVSAKGTRRIAHQRAGFLPAAET